MNDHINDKVKHECFLYCKHHLKGVWNQVNEHMIELKRIFGGSTNKLYHCSLSSGIKPIGDEPTQVVILIYGQKQFNKYVCDENTRLSDVIVNTLTAEKKISPQVYGIFDNGIIIEFCKHQQFKPNHQRDSMIVKEVAKILARIHGLDVPIKKNTSDWLSNTLDTYYDMAYKLFPINQLIDECNCDTLKNNDLKREIAWVKQLLTKTDSPVVFCHNDFRGDNVMIIDNECDRTIRICDFEYACYGYRGYDFGHLFSEWGRDVYDRNAFPSLQDFPNDSIVKAFINDYIEESVKVVGQSFVNDKRNSVDHMLKEIQIFSVIDNLWTTLVMLKFNIPELMPDKRFIMLYANYFYKNYFHLKKQFIDQKLFS